MTVERAAWIRTVADVMQAAIDISKSAASRCYRLLPRPLSAIRLYEVAQLPGSPLIAASFAVTTIDANSLITGFCLLVGSCFLVAHVFLFNDWSGIAGDLRDLNRARLTFVTRGITREQVGWLSGATLAIGLLIFAYFDWTSLTLAAAIAGLSALYSAPCTHLKGLPLANSLLHLTGGLLHFLLGYSMFGPIDMRGVAIGSFFALMFTAGHFTHEARDHEGDRANRIRTNAVAFGKATSFVMGLVLFTAAYGLLIALAFNDVIARGFAFVGVLHVLHLAASINAFRQGLTFDSIHRLQRWYRSICLLIGVLMVGSVHSPV